MNQMKTLILPILLIISGQFSLLFSQQIGCETENAQNFSCFTSVEPRAQNQFIEIPKTHAFQLFFKQGDSYTEGGGNVPGNNDFTGFIPIKGSSTMGYVSVNHENSPGGVSIVDVEYNSELELWELIKSRAVDFSKAEGTVRNCSGGVTPWGTVITSEESNDEADNNNDGYQAIGWQVEIDPVTAKIKYSDTTLEYASIQDSLFGSPKVEVIRDQKLWALGTMNHENIVIAKDSMTAYQAEDGGSGCLFKFVADNKMDLRSGTLYALEVTGGLLSGSPASPEANWVVVPNFTKTERNNTSSLASAAGGTNFGGAEDVEINPVTGEIFWTSKSHNRVYALTDLGLTATKVRTYVGGGTSYDIIHDNGITTESWASGNDNLTFDNFGNLYVLQDGSRNHIWFVGKEHKEEDPQVELFLLAPSGSEPTGMTFTPDNRFAFLSIQHPSSLNELQEDATGENVSFNASATIVIARKEYLGYYGPTSGVTSLTSTVKDCKQIRFNWTNGNGTNRMVLINASKPVDTNPVDGVQYFADSVFGMGSEIGNGNFVVYNGDTSTVNFLLPEGISKVYYKIIEFNRAESQDFYNYKEEILDSVELNTPITSIIMGKTNPLAGDTIVYSVLKTDDSKYDWEINGGIILQGNETNEVVVLWVTNGEIIVQETDAFGCKGMKNSQIVELETIQLIGAKEIKKLTVYPNPTKAEVYVTGFSFNDIQEVQLISLTGQSVKLVMENNKIDLNSFSNGIYSIRISTESGEFYSKVTINK
ncbi:MAG: secreted PhoX family phosphatase [Sphingobacteriales bacterium]|jgi:secreted PhoX family phosphatase